MATNDAQQARRRDTGDEGAGRVLRTVDDAEVYVASVCFKHGPPRPTRLELEWLVHPAAAPAAPVDPAVLRTALGPHAPPSLQPSPPARALPGGSTVTVEPGGQVEPVGLPPASFGALVRTVTADAEHLHRRLAAHGLAVSPLAVSPARRRRAAPAAPGRARRHRSRPARPGHRRAQQRPAGPGWSRRRRSDRLS